MDGGFLNKSNTKMSTPTPTSVPLPENAITKCFGDIVGTVKDTNSDSNLWIEDLEAMSTIMGLIDGYDGNDYDINEMRDSVIEKLENSRRIAIMKLHTDLTTLLMRYAKPRGTISGLIGSKKWDKVSTDVGKSGIRIVCRPIKDAEIVLKGINTLFTQTGEISLYLASNYSDDVVDLGVFDTTQNKFKYNKLDEAIVLPCYNEAVEYVEYYIYHENTIKPLNTRISCSSCSSFHYSAEYPRFANHGWKEYINFAGFNGNPETLPEKGLNTTKGLQLLADIRCRTDRAICNESIDYHSNPMAMSYAVAIQYKAGSVIIWDLIRDSGLNRILMGDMESFRDAATYYERKYNDMVRYISKNMEIQSDCFCEHGFAKMSIGHP